MPIYLDHNATTQPTAEVVEAVMRALGEWWANPSSVHRPGQQVRQQIELARADICSLLGCLDRELIITSGGTESANLALRGSLEAQAKRNVLVTSRLEHSAVRETAQKLAERDVEVIWLDTEPNGLVSLEHLERVLRDRAKETALVSIMWANNETGVIQPIERIGALCREHGVRLHTDATQWVGKMPVNLTEVNIDLLTFSAHKFHGPKGVGGLYVREGVRVSPQPIGGPQERERRGGTENVPGIMGLGVAAKQAREWLRDESAGAQPQAALRDRFESAIVGRVSGAVVNGGDAPRLWNTTNIAFPALEAEPMLLALSERGVCASAGAACSSGSLDPSPVLLALGLDEQRVAGSIRFSLARDTSAEEIDQGIEIICETLERLRVLA